MLLYLSITGIILSLILLLFNAGKFRSTIYLGLFFLTLSLYGFNQYVLLYSNSLFLVTIFATNITFLSYLIGPMLYWYIRSILTDKYRLKNRDFWHFVPMLIYLLAALPYMFSSYSYKEQIAKEIIKDLGFVMTFNFTILSKIFSNTVVYLSRPVLVLGYTIWSIVLLAKYLRGHLSSTVFSRQHFMTKWLSFLLGFQLLLVVSHLLSIFITFHNDSSVFFTVNSLQILSSTGLIGLVVSPFFFPMILYGLPRFAESVANPIAEVAPVVIPEVAGMEEEILREHNFESDYLLSIGQKTESCMLEFQPYLQPELNLNRFSDIIQVPAHHLAYFFREVKKQSFNDYINACRVEYAKILMSEGRTGELTFEAVGILSGFTNRSTFFRAFKKSEGTSPGSFLASKGKIAL